MGPYIFAKMIKIRSANLGDLQALLDLDAKVTAEYFLPLYQKIFSNLKDPEAHLKQELQTDKEIFEEAILRPRARAIQMAIDEDANALAGFIVFNQQSDDLVLIELLVVSKDYRGQMIGNKLVNTVFQIYPHAKICDVYTLQQDTVWQFYEKIGFAKLGVGPSNQTNFYGQKYSEAYFWYRRVR